MALFDLIPYSTPTLTWVYYYAISVLYPRKEGSQMNITGSTLIIIFICLVFGAIVAAISDRWEYDSAGLIMKGFFILALLPWLVIFYTCRFINWAFEHI